MTLNISYIGANFNADTIISRSLFLRIFISFVNIIFPTFILLGIIANITNLFTFLKMKLTESVTISFFALSLADLAYLLCSGLTTATGVIGMSPLARDIPVDLLKLGSFISWFESIFFDCSMGITTYIAVARCCCVVIAFKFKNAFTIRRTAAFILAVFIVSIIFRIPLLANHTMTWMTNPLTNRTIMMVQYTSGWTSVLAVHDILNRTIIPNSALAVVLICMGILIFKLIEASRIRKSMTSYSYGVQESSAEVLGERSLKKRFSTKTTSCVGGKDRATQKVKPNVLGKKEIQVVKSVTLVSSVFVLSVLVMSLKAMAQVLVPGFDWKGKYGYLNILVGQVTYSVSHFSAGVNVFIYYHFNTKFRATLVQSLTACGKTTK